MSVLDWLRSTPESTELERAQITFNIPGILSINTTIRPNTYEADLANTAYVQMATRIATRQMEADGGLRGALSSLRDVVLEGRQALVHYGRYANPDRGPQGTSAAQIVGIVINDLVAPVLSHWHDRLQRHELRQARMDARPAPADNPDWEPPLLQFDGDAQLRRVLDDLRPLLVNYCLQLQKIAKCGDLLAHSAKALAR